MSITHYFNPVRSIVGAGALAQLPDLLAGRAAALVVFPQARETGLLARLHGLLGSQLAVVIDDVRSNPDVAELRETWTRFWRQHAEVPVLIAVGGGSVIDTAKVLMVAHAQGFDALVDDLERGRGFEPSATKTLIAVPTTAGTGSEVTPWATVWDRSAGRKHSLHLRQTWPTHALLDAELMLSLPAAPTLHSGLDALSHALEALWNRHANPVSDTFAISAVRDIQQVLPRLMSAPGDIELREAMALAALKAGLAFSNTRTALAHSISYDMTLRHGLPHGLACSFPLPAVLERALGVHPGRDRVLCEALGVPSSRAVDHLRAFLEGLGVATHFADYGVGEAEEKALIAQALTGARGRNFIGA